MQKKGNNHFQIMGFYETHIGTAICSKTALPRSVMGPTRELNTIILLNGYSIKLIYYYFKRFPTLIREGVSYTKS